MKNVNDEVPLFEPSNPVVRVKKGASRGFLVHTMQAFDPDGDEITFTATPSQLIASASLLVYPIPSVMPWLHVK